MNRIHNNLDIDLTPFYRDLLLRPTPTDSTSVGNCVLKGWLHTLGNKLNFDSMRIFLYQDDVGKYMQRQIFGDKDYWKGFNIEKVKKEKTVYKHIFFVKIKHIRENGQILILGYLSFHTMNYVSNDLMDKLEILCMLYGNYIVKRVIHGRHQNFNLNVSKAYKIASSKDLPGTKVLNLISNMHHISCFNRGLFCTVCGNRIVPEYVASKESTTFVRKPTIISCNQSFIEEIYTSYNNNQFFLADLPRKLINFIQFKDKRSEDEFTISIYPVYVDEELIAMWLFSYSRNNPFDQSETKNLLEDLYPLMMNSYKFLFQRRFKKMVVNPIFQYRDTRIQENSVFIIMPFTETWSDDVWHQVIQPAVKESNMMAVRADDLYGANIMEDVWQSILKAAIIICDTTGRNPNVFYELGIAHTLGKKVVLLTQNIKDIPFDLQAYRHIKYDTTLSGGNQLKEDLKKHIAELLK